MKRNPILKNYAREAECSLLRATIEDGARIEAYWRKQRQDKDDIQSAIETLKSGKLVKGILCRT